MKLRSLLHAVLTVVSLAAIAPDLARATVIVSIQPASVSAVGTAPVSLAVNISGVTDLFAFQFDVGFNPAVVSAGTQSEGAFLPSGGSTFFVPGTVDNVGGTVTAIADSLTGFTGVSGSGTLATLFFQPTHNGTSTITLFNVTLFDSALNGIPTANQTIQSGSITVSGIPSSVPEPSTSSLVAGAVLSLAGMARRKLRQREA